MARKTKAKAVSAEEGEEKPSSPLASADADALVESLVREYGEGVCLGGAEVADEERAVLSVSPMFDVALSGGIPEGSWVSIVGPPKYGKSTLILSFAALAQRPENGTRPIFYFDVEGRLKKKNLRGIEGLDLSPERFRVVRSTEQKILSSQDYLRIAEQVVHTVPRAVVLIDSISALVDERELTGGIGTETRGGGAKLISQFCAQLSNVVPVRRCIVVGVVHLIANTSGFGQSMVERAANRWQYQADVKLKVLKSDRWPEKERGPEAGRKMQWVVVESALGLPNQECESYLRYGKGIDHTYEMLQLATSLGLIQQRGAWYYFVWLEHHPDLWPEGMLEWDEKPFKAQGAEVAYRLLSSRPDWKKSLADGLRTLCAPNSEAA